MATRSSSLEGRLLNLGNATGDPSFVMSNSFTNEVIAEIDLLQQGGRLRQGGSTCSPKHLDEKVARLHLDALGVELRPKLQTLSRPPTSACRRGPLKSDPDRY